MPQIIFSFITITPSSSLESLCLVPKQPHQGSSSERAYIHHPQMEFLEEDQKWSWACQMPAARSHQGRVPHADSVNLRHRHSEKLSREDFHRLCRGGDRVGCVATCSSLPLWSTSRKMVTALFSTYSLGRIVATQQGVMQQSAGCMERQ